MSDSFRFSFFISYVAGVVRVAWRLSGVCLEGVWKVSGRCLKGVSRVSGGCLCGVWGCLKNVLSILSILPIFALFFSCLLTDPS